MTVGPSILSRHVRRYGWIVASIWTAAIAASFTWGVYQENLNFRDAALKESVAYLNKDKALRLWATTVRSIYVPSSLSPPNPYMADIRERDIVTPSGKELTLISHVRMLEEINEGYARLFGVTGHLTSLNLVRPDDRPDPWERKSLEKFERDRSMQYVFTTLNGQPYLRLMRPVVTEERCLTCHGRQGYRAGEVRGGISIELPLAEQVVRRNRLTLTLGFTHSLLWIMGLLLIRVGSRKLAQGVSERERIESALRKSEERYRRISSAVTDYTYTVRIENGRAVELIHTTTCVAVTGYTRDEFVQTPSLWLDIVHPDDRDPLLDFSEGLLSGVKSRPIEYRIRHRNGSIRHVINHPLLHFDSEGRLMAYEGLVRDITEQKQIEHRLFQSQKMQSISTLAGGIAHDFNNMMTGVLGYAELMKGRVLDDPKNLKMLDHISTSARRAGDLAQQLLAYARGGKYQPCIMSLNQAVAETLGLQQHAFPPGIAVERDMAPDLWTVKADPTQMQQVVMNLCMNAVEASGKTGSLTLRTRNVEISGESLDDGPDLSPGQYAHLQVHDEGTGMDAETMSSIFDPFFSTKAQGRGMGLSAVYGIVQNHGGLIQASSRPGAGTTFDVYLPAQTGENRKPGDTPASAGDGVETVLIVDDEESVREVSSEILGQRGYTVLSAVDGRQAVEIVAGHRGPIHLVLLDLGLPGMSGPETFLNLQKQRPELRFVIISGYDLDREVQDLLDRGAIAFLQKPFLPDELVALVRRALDTA